MGSRVARGLPKADVCSVKSVMGWLSSEEDSAPDPSGRVCGLDHSRGGV